MEVSLYTFSMCVCDFGPSFGGNTLTQCLILFAAEVPGREGQGRSGVQ